MTQLETSPQSWLSPEEAHRFNVRWEEVQVGFVSNPRAALGEADALVAGIVGRMATRLTEERRALQSRWSPADTPTESLRVSLQSYRDLVDALLG